MGRIKERKIIITFHTTTDAMAMEEWCKEHSVSGRIIPVPPSISAGCGLAWCSEPEKEKALKKALQEASLSYYEIHQCEI